MSPPSFTLYGPTATKMRRKDEIQLLYLHPWSKHSTRSSMKITLRLLNSRLQVHKLLFMVIKHLQGLHIVFHQKTPDPACYYVCSKPTCLGHSSSYLVNCQSCGHIMGLGHGSNTETTPPL